MHPPYFVAHETSRMDELDGLPLASFAQRAAGFIIDLLIVIVLWVPLELLWARYISHEWDGQTHYHITFSFHEWRSLMVALLYYVVVNCLTNGRSLGKWIAHTRIMSLSHQRVGFWQSIERVLGYAAATAEGLGFLQYFWSHNRMCVQDRIAETIVVDVRKIAKHQPTSDNLVS